MHKTYYWLPVFILPFFLFSQENNHQVWNNLEFRYNAFQKTSFSFDGGIRTDIISSESLKYFSDFSFKKKCTSVFSYSMGYRYALDRRKDSFEAKHRFYSDFFFKKEVAQNFKIINRSRFQIQKNAFDFFVNKIRQKIKFNYTVGALNLDAYVSLELFCVLEEVLEKSRYVVGVETPIVRNLELNVSYMAQQDYDVDVSDLLFAFRTKLKYRF